MKPTVLLVMDGWGIAPASKRNAITLAKPTFFDHLCKTQSYTELHASGKHVGLLPGYIGNSEVGHLHLGAGRLEQQDLAHILDEIKSGKFYKNKVLVDAMKKAKKGALHLLGLVSDGGVHSHQKHLYALLELASRHNIEHVYVHAITDGRDVPPKSASKYLSALQRKLQSYNKSWRIATVLGRYYGMDRDNRWDREHKAYASMVRDEGRTATSWKEAIDQAYERGETDEFISPTNIIRDQSYNIRNGDVVIFFNFRSDRARQITRAFVDGVFNKFKRQKKLKLHFVCLTQYDANIRAPVAYPPRIIRHGLGQLISSLGHKQLRIAETEKYAHVTYFFNGLRESPFAKEERILIPSPKVKTYDTRPKMRLNKITTTAEQAIKSGKYAFILINYANADMVAHTGNLPATIEAIQHQDKCVARLSKVCESTNTLFAITADHGNAEQLRYSDGSICTAHTTNKVPFVIQSLSGSLKKRGALYNVAPTLLQVAGLKSPKVMASSLLRS